MMVDKNAELKARKLLPDPTEHPHNYIEIKVPLKNGKHNMVTFMKREIDGKLYWLALPYSR